jgi:hypothetical protein
MHGSYMASVTDTLPQELMQPWRKAAVIEWIRATSLPSRFRRKLLQEWGDRMSVPITGEDYVAVTEAK